MKEFFANKKIINQFPVCTQLIPCSTQNIFAVKAKGNGLSPRIRETDILICEFTDQFKDKEFVAIEGKDGLENWLAVKQKNGFIFKKTNDDYPYILDKKNPQIIGVVRMLINNHSFTQW